MIKSNEPKRCPDCESSVLDQELNRRGFLKTSVSAAVVSASTPLWAVPKALASAQSDAPAETAVKALYDSLSDSQKRAVCFDWNHMDPQRGLLRTFVSNNWHITSQAIRSDFYSKEQQMLIHDVFKDVFNPEWYERLVKQLRDDTEGKPWGSEQNIAIFGKPGEGNFEFVMTGRHLTIRVDGNSEPHVALGGPIFHGHAASGFNEKVGHPGNIFWHQALKANQIYQMLDGKQRQTALVTGGRPEEQAVDFHGSAANFPGIPVAELAADQKNLLQEVLASLIEPYRKQDQDEVMECMKRQGGLEKCSLAFYQDGDLGNDGEWDNWRLEGPSFVWYFRGEPHVHIWINVADDPSVELNA